MVFGVLKQASTFRAMYSFHVHIYHGVTKVRFLLELFDSFDPKFEIVLIGRMCIYKLADLAFISP